MSLFKFFFTSKYDKLAARVSQLEDRIDDLEYDLWMQREQGETQMKSLEDIKIAVEAETTVVASAVKLLEELSKIIEDNKVDAAEMAAIVDSINANKDALAAAVVANTPDAGGSTGGIVG